MTAINLASIRRNSTANSFDRGEEYYRNGAVLSLSQWGTVFQALVEGSDVNPYRITAHVDAAGLSAVTCTCPYDFEGWCKHIVASLLTYDREPGQIVHRPPLIQTLQTLTPQQLQKILQDLTDRHPELLEEIDHCAVLMTTPIISSSLTGNARPTRRIAIDPQSYRKQAKALLHQAVNNWESGFDDDGDMWKEPLFDLIDKGVTFAQAGDGESAIAILEGITQGCVEDWDVVDDYGADNTDIVDQFNDAWSEAILTAELSIDQELQLRSKLESWQDTWQGCSFEMALLALEQGWDDPRLVDILEGNLAGERVVEGQQPESADSLALTRLMILNREQRYDEYLNLAQAEGQVQSYLTMLGRLGRVEDAVAIAQTQMTTLDEAFALAKTLRDQGAIDSALDIAQTGLTLPIAVPKPDLYGFTSSSRRLCYDMAVWTSEFAEGLNRSDIALACRIQAFQEEVSFQDYQHVQTLAGDRWDEIKLTLLQRIEQEIGRNSTEKILIFLHENLVEKAMPLSERLGSYEKALINQVVVAAIPVNPDWVIANMKDRAESIMNAGKADKYQNAADWLKNMKAAYVGSNRLAEWKVYRSSLTGLHGRKRKLMGLIPG